PVRRHRTSGRPSTAAGSVTPDRPCPPSDPARRDPEDDRMDTAALKSSWAGVAAHGDEGPLYFYSHLFLSHPDLRQMFPIQMSGQRDKLVAALGHIVSNVDQLDDVVPFIEQLGRDHRRFRVRNEHYAAVGASLLAT